MIEAPPGQGRAGVLREVRGGTMTTAGVAAVAEAVAADLDYAFECTWAPRWEGKRP